MQSIPTGDNLHEMSNPVFWEKLEKCHQIVVWLDQTVVMVKLFQGAGAVWSQSTLFTQTFLYEYLG